MFGKLKLLYKRKNYSTGTTWEKTVGYSRAVRVGNQIYIAGTTSTDNNHQIVGKGDPYKQTIQIMKNIQMALNAVDADLQNVVRSKIYVTDIGMWSEIAKGHREFFKEIQPACTMVEVSNLMHSDMLVEIEIDAIVF